MMRRLPGASDASMSARWAWYLELGTAISPPERAADFADEQVHGARRLVAREASPRLGDVEGHGVHGVAGRSRASVWSSSRGSAPPSTARCCSLTSAPTSSASTARRTARAIARRRPPHAAQPRPALDRPRPQGRRRPRGRAASVDRADVLVDPYRPGCSSASAWARTSLLARNPRIVVARMTGWGQDGPRAGERRARHRLHRSRRGAARDRPRRRRARRPAQPRRGLRRRRDAARVRHHGGAAGACAFRSRPGRRRRDGRWRRLSSRDFLQDRASGAGSRRAGATGCRARAPGTAPM